MVAHEGVAFLDVQVVGVDVDSGADGLHQLLEEGIAEGFLEIEVRLALLHLLPDGLHGDARIEVGQHVLELRVGQQTVKHFRQFFGFERPYGVKL